MISTAKKMLSRSLLRRIHNQSSLLFRIPPFPNASSLTTTTTTCGSFDSEKFKRTHYCGSLDANHHGQQVTLCGWLHSLRSKNFILVRDTDGIVQVFLEDNMGSVSAKTLVDSLTEESVVAIKYGQGQSKV